MILSKNASKAYILGIGGSSMQAIAIILKQMGFWVGGSDNRYDKYYEILSKKDIEIDVSPCLDKIKKVDFIIYSLAINEQSQEFLQIKKLNKPMLSRKQFLKLFSSRFNDVVAISGTHGKSTTTYLIASILKKMGLQATYHIGASSKSILGGGLYMGDKIFVTEACEYKDSFLSLSPSIAVVLNIERDHPDYFTSVDMLKNSFCMFSSNIKDNGILITNTSLAPMFKKYLASINRCDINVISVGDGGDYWQENEKLNDITSFTLCSKQGIIGDFTTTLNGYYNIYNIIISIVVALNFNVPINIIKQVLSNIETLDRRNELMCYYNGASVITDYAHHPSEINAIIKSTKERTKGKVIVVFQPHTYSRTTALFNDFINCFTYADKVIITKTYKSRESSGVKTSFDLFVEVSKIRNNVYYFDDFISIASYLKDSLKQGETLLLLGAGNINELSKLLK